MKPYKIIEEDDQFVTYEFITSYIYMLYLILSVMLIGIWLGNRWLSGSGVCLMILYFLTVSIPYMTLHRKLRKAMREDSVEFSGSKWSLAKPLKMKLKKDIQITAPNATSN